MHSGSPFYHFKSKDALLCAVMEEGMHAAIARQTKALQGVAAAEPLEQIRRLIRAHFETLLGPGNDFVPVMLYEHRSLNARQRALLAKLQAEYEAAWTPVLEALHASGQLRAPVKLSRLLILGALNWSVQWFDRKKGASLNELTDAAMVLFLKDC
jgi:AcrR family transcriptional regulator